MDSVSASISTTASLHSISFQFDFLFLSFYPLGFAASLFFFFLEYEIWRKQEISEDAIKRIHLNKKFMIYEETNGEIPKYNRKILSEWKTKHF